MHCCKANMRLLSRLNYLTRQSYRPLSVPATSATTTSEKELQPPESFAETALAEKDDKKKPQVTWEYPPILDLSITARKRREREEWHDRVKQLGTVEEKIFELNMPRYYGWKSSALEEGSYPYDPLPKAQYITRTHVVDKPGLPSYYDSIISPEALDSAVQQIKSQVEEALILEYGSKNLKNRLDSDELENKVLMDNLIAKAVSNQINRILTTNLSPTYPHLMETQADHEPRIEAFWFFGGFEVPNEVRKSRAGLEWKKEFKEDPVDQCIKYKGSPILQLRHNLPLKEIISLADSEDNSFEVPVEPLDPRKTSYFQERLRATIIPGFWPGDFSEFGVTSYHNRGYLVRRPPQFNDNLDALKTQAVLGSFSWLYGQACYQGFSTFQDPTYPLVNQSIITNGRWWSFSTYQLNTTRMHIDAINENPKKNICWMTEPMKLFEAVHDGKVEGFNEDVLKYLIQFYVNTPEAKEGVEMKPYLRGEKLVANIEEDERRIWLEERYKYLLSNRKRHLLEPEIYHWQKIYKIDHKTRPVDKKWEPWEFGINMYKRRLDYHTREYIPRRNREHHRSRKKFKETYYPSIRHVE